MSYTTGNNLTLTTDTYNCYPYTSTPYQYVWHYCNGQEKTIVVEKYQLICPKCDTTNWGEIEEIVVCSKKGCGKTLKATKRVADYEIVVD
jgi:hypothetical protein